MNNKLKTSVEKLNATITGLTANSKGEIKTKLGDTQSTATTIPYPTSTLSAIAVVLAAVI